MHVVVIEHENDDLDQVVRLFSRSEHQLTTARNGDDGLRLVRDHRPKLVLSAVGPPSNGLHVVLSLRIDKAFDGVRVVALTYFSQLEDRRHLLSVGFDGLIAKPIEESFMSQVEKFLD